MKHAWAVIPARGGSKAIPNKNLARVGGLTLIARSVLAAQSADIFEAVVVSTDCRAIAEEAKQLGANVVDRPPELSHDFASSESAVAHALDASGQLGLGPLPDVTVMMQPTSPFVKPRDLNNLVQAVNSFDVCFTITPDHAFLWRRNTDGVLTPVQHDPSSARKPRQLLGQQFRETGAAYAMRTAGFLVHMNRFFGKIGGVVVDPSSSMEIDEYSDLISARSLAGAGGHGVTPSDDQESAAPSHEGCNHYR